MTRIEIERVLPADPERVWHLVTDPVQMNRWSEATITPGRDGAHRRVEIPLLGLRMRLEEEILESEPPRRLVYSVISGGGLRSHRGVQTLQPVADGRTRLHWEVRFVPWIPGSGPLHRALLLPKLERSLTTLERIAATSS